MKNIEIKARYDDLAKARETALRIGAVRDADLFQLDTYFTVANGRLKLREINSRENQLIYYERPDVASAKESEYEILPIQDATKLKTIMEKSVGIWKIVAKQREVFLYDEVRIHLDQVESLGNFLEFEGVIQADLPEQVTREKVERLLREFQISSEDLIQGSYSDLLGEATFED